MFRYLAYWYSRQLLMLIIDTDQFPIRCADYTCCMIRRGSEVLRAMVKAAMVVSGFNGLVLSRPTTTDVTIDRDLAASN